MKLFTQFCNKFKMIATKTTTNRLNGKVFPNVLSITDNQSIALARMSLERGEVIALPTDTVYGLACSANDPIAIKNLYSIKGREEEKPVAICVADLKSFRHWGCAEHLSDELLNRLLPGPITIIIEKSQNLDNPYLNPGISKIGIRIPAYQFIQSVCANFNQPLALTSANKSHEKSTLNIDEFQPLWSRLGMVFDGGQLGLTEESRSASTVVDLSVPGKFKIVRNGIALSNTLNVLDSFNIVEMN